METIAELVERLAAPDNKAACGACSRLMDLCGETEAVYPYWEQIVPLLDSPKSLQRNRGLQLLAALAPWDDRGRFASILDRYLQHVTDTKPITSRQCIQSLPKIAAALPALKPRIMAALENADAGGYADSMKPLVEKDIRVALEQIAAEEQQKKSVKRDTK